jgi:uncharacterized SAM-binding protein YcdF (DUF218 family)
MIEKSFQQPLEIIWQYLHLNQTLEPADLLLVLGSEYSEVANRGVDLYLQKLAPIILFSGGLGVVTQHTQTTPEADRFAQIALARGVPQSTIYIENQSANTGQNIEFSRELIIRKQLPHHRIIVVTKPEMERRAYATFKKVWPEPEIQVTSPQISLNEYVINSPNRDLTINLMVGYVQRMKLYYEKGFQIQQDIPSAVWQAHLDLAALGYDQQLIR